MIVPPRKPAIPGEWFGFDLDGTLAKYDGWQGKNHIGPPIPTIVDELKALRALGYEVRIFTARVAESDPEELAEVVAAIDAWALKHLGEVLPITNVKDYGMIATYDDRVIQVVSNEGVIVQQKLIEALLLVDDLTEQMNEVL